MPPARPALARTPRIAATLVLGTVAALAAQALQLPLPWMLGPLAATAAAGVLGAPLAASGRLRNAGQWGIGVALGLTFTPATLALLAALAPALAAGVAWALLMGHLFDRALRRWGGAPDRATAFFAGAIGGASEMAVLAERHGGQVDRVAAAHSLRLLLVVSLIPIGLQAGGVHGADLAQAAPRAVHPAGLLGLAAASAAGVALLHALRVPNPFVLGALAVTMALTVSGLAPSGLPPGVADAAQLFIGVSLGARFTPDFVRAAPRWLAAVALGTLAMLGASALFAAALAGATGLHWATALLGTSPGGIAEMAITAQVLQLGVPVVTTFHVVRYVAVLLLVPWLWRRAAASAAA